MLEYFKRLIAKFYHDNCLIYASALTFYTVFAIVPAFAIFFAVANNIGVGEFLQVQLAQYFSGQEAVLNKIITFSESLLMQVKGGVVAFTGLVFLLLSVFTLLMHIENNFNIIWRQQRKRKQSKRLINYFLFVVFFPLFFAISSFCNIYIIKLFSGFLGDYLPIGYLSGVMTFVLLCAILTWLYQVVPNAAVPIKNAFLSAIIVSACFYILQWSLIDLQITITSYSAIYGSFAIVPLFLIWCKCTWVLVLLGAQMSYAFTKW